VYRLDYSCTLALIGHLVLAIALDRGNCSLHEIHRESRVAVIGPLHCVLYTATRIHVITSQYRVWAIMHCQAAHEAAVAAVCMLHSPRAPSQRAPSRLGLGSSVCPRVPSCRTCCHCLSSPDRKLQRPQPSRESSEAACAIKELKALEWPSSAQPSTRATAFSPPWQTRACAPQSTAAQVAVAVAEP